MINLITRSKKICRLGRSLKNCGTIHSVFILAQMMMCIMTLHNFPPFVGSNVISDGATNELLIYVNSLSAHKIKKKNAFVDWENQTAAEVDCQYRAFCDMVGWLDFCIGMPFFRLHYK